LGRGLGALLGSASPTAQPAPSSAAPPVVAAPAPAPDTRERVQRIALERIQPCPLQPRKEFSDQALQELADSIREQGIIQPLIARERHGGFELIAGERRFRAAQKLGLKEVPVIVREADDRAVLELALIENLQRENLNPIEEAQGYAQLIQQFQMRQEEVADKVGKSRAVVANSLRLLKLDPELQAHVRGGRLSVGHAKVILGLSLAAEQKLAAERIIKQSLNVRQTEDLVAYLQRRASDGPGGKSTGRGATPVARDAHLAELENRLQERFGSKVQLHYRQGKGSVEIRFYNDADLNRILTVAGITMD